ncbi:hypothetical protein BJX68DRAFT_272530 [Aspergillus pseudodeflectus]|uniref:NACHT domain-containing protein n=1 Tax=Aspergillus pseudodeflectus TaxID=176178 RepID=A0ABR4JI17_9EURO
MEPMSAISLAASVCQFVDFACRIISKGNKLRGARHGLLVEDADLLAASTRVVELNNRLVDSLGVYSRSERGSLEMEARAQINAACRGLNHVATELIDTLNKLRLPGGSGRWRSMRQAVKAVRGRQGVEKMKNDIIVYQQRLNTALLISIYARLDPSFTYQDPTRGAGNRQAPLLSSKSLDLLFAGSRSPPAQWQTHLMDKVLANTQPTALAMQVAIFRDELSSITARKAKKRTQQQLIGLLSFPDLHDRDYRITNAHQDTFQWIFAGPNDRHPRKWRLFAPWLQGQESIYWITGKPGSGKSTLMKFLSKSQQTTANLRVWAGNLPLVKVHFYFWNSGSLQQMSLDGLYRSIVHGILTEYPDLVPEAFPCRWKTWTLFGQDLRDWNAQEIHQAFRVLLAKSGHTYRLCLFIDGLDECEGPHDAFVEELFSITKKHNVKLCLASRPWPVFETAFSTGAHLMLQDLTFPDIVRFTWKNLSSHRGFRSLVAAEENFASSLVLEIAQKSSGVFLWVDLVVKSLLQGFTNADRISDLHRRLEDIPGDLEALYLKMFDSIEPFYYQHSSQYFQIALAATGQLSALTFYFADEEDPTIAFTAPIKPLTDAERLSKYHAIKTRLMACCKGFLEIPSPLKPPALQGNGVGSYGGPVSAEGTAKSYRIDDDIDRVSFHAEDQDDQTEKCSLDAPDGGEISEPDRKVTYLHRTAKDFLESNAMRRRILDPSLGQYDPYCSIFRAALLVLKTLPWHRITREEIWRVTEMCLQLAESSESVEKRALTKHLDELDKTAAQLFRDSRMCGEITDWTATRWKSPVDNSSRAVGFLALTAEANLKRYILSKFEAGLPRFAFSADRPNLDWIITSHATYPAFCEHPDPGGPGGGGGYLLPSRQLIKVLLENKEDPNEAFGDDQTPWIKVFEQAAKCAGDNALPQTQKISILSHWADIADLFISHDADPLVIRQSSVHSKVREIFGALLPDRAKAMEKKLRHTRSRWSAIGRFIVPRNPKLVKLSIEPTPLPRLKTLDSAHAPSQWGDQFRPGSEQPQHAHDLPRYLPGRCEANSPHYSPRAPRNIAAIPFQVSGSTAAYRSSGDTLYIDPREFRSGLDHRHSLPAEVVTSVTKPICQTDKPDKITAAFQPSGEHLTETTSRMLATVPRVLLPYFVPYVKRPAGEQQDGSASSNTTEKDNLQRDSEDTNSGL